jgi:hypothetical protein
MDDIVTDVNEGWNDEDPTQSMQCVFLFLLRLLGL